MIYQSIMPISFSCVLGYSYPSQEIKHDNNQLAAHERLGTWERGEDGRMAGGDGSLSKDDRLIIFNITHYKLQILLPLPVRPPIRVE